MTCEHCGASTGWVDGHRLESANESKRDAFKQIETFTRERDIDFDVAKGIAMYLYEQFYKNISPEFELLDSLSGVLSQISNMSSGFPQERDAFLRERDEAREQVAYLRKEIQNLAEVKGRHHSEVAMNRLFDALNSTAESAKSYEREIRNRVLEEAADVCDDRILYTGLDCAEAIRAMKD